MVTIRDVAREAKVSVSTVSHVINKTRFVAAETAQTVQEAIDRLGYAPNGIARALKGSRTRTLGMIVTSSTNPFFAQVIHGVETTCFDHGYSLILCNSDDEPVRQLAYLDALRSKRIDGLVMLTANSALQLTGEANDLPTVLLDTPPRRGCCVVADNSAAGGRMAAEFLLGRGFRRLACITGPDTHPRSNDRLYGVCAAMACAQLPLDPALVRAADLTVSGGFAAAAALLDLPEPPEAIFAFNDMMAIGALRAGHARGLAVPSDLAVIGYDDIELAAYLTPPLTTIRQPAAALGSQAAERLIDHLEQGSPLPSTVTLMPELVVRDSVGWAAPRGAP